MHDMIVYVENPKNWQNKMKKQNKNKPHGTNKQL